MFQKWFVLLSLFVFSIQSQAHRFTLPEDSVIEIPFQLTKQGEILVMANVNGLKRTFQFDTGSKTLIFGDHLNVSSSEKNESENITVGGTHMYNRIIIKEFDFYGIKASNLQSLATNIQTTDTIDGLLGYEVFRYYDVLFDFRRNTITLIKPTCLPKIINLYGKVLYDDYFVLHDFIPVVECSIKNKTLLLGLDTGATTALLPTRTKDILYHNLSKEIPASIAGLEDKGISAWAASIKRFHVGKAKYKKMMTVFYDSPIIDYLGIDGLVGLPFLLQHTFLIGYASGRIIIFK